MKKFLIPILLAFVFFTINQDLFAQKNQRMDRQNFRENIKEKLNLTTEQESKIEALRLTHEEEMIILRNELDLKELEMKKLNSGDAISRNDVLKLTRELSEIKGKMDIARAEHRMDVYDLLNADQKKIWLDMDKNMRMMKDKRQERKHHKRTQLD